MTKDNLYKVKEIFYTLQGEGAQAGRASVFCRFSKCNLWSGQEKSRASAICNFCDTDFNGTDGQNGGTYTLIQLTNKISSLWPDLKQGSPYVVCTGGEPLLQLDEPLIDSLHAAGFEVGVETNGTLAAPQGIDWLCVSPKGIAEVVIAECNELKLVYPQSDALPQKFTHIKAEHFYLQPMADYRPQLIMSDSHQAAREGLSADNTKAALEYCLANPKWKLCLQTHKYLEID